MIKREKIMEYEFEKQIQEAIGIQKAKINDLVNETLAATEFQYNTDQSMNFERFSLNFSNNVEDYYKCKGKLNILNQVLGGLEVDDLETMKKHFTKEIIMTACAKKYPIRSITDFYEQYEKSGESEMIAVILGMLA